MAFTSVFKIVLYFRSKQTQRQTNTEPRESSMPQGEENWEIYTHKTKTNLTWTKNDTKCNNYRPHISHRATQGMKIHAYRSSGNIKGIGEDGIQALFKVSTGLVQKRIILTTQFPGESGLMMTPYQ